MADMHNDDAGKSAAASGTQSTPDSGLERSLYNYESSGITEREGNVPIWLWIVVVSLLIWGCYYLIAFWNGPITLT